MRQNIALDIDARRTQPRPALDEKVLTGWNGLAPSYVFSLAMLGWVVLLNALGIWKLRKWNPSGEAIMQREGPGDDPEANLTDDELKEQLLQAKQDLWQTRFQLNTRQLKDYSSIPQTRRTIARILTVQQERRSERSRTA